MNLDSNWIQANEAVGTTSEHFQSVHPCPSIFANGQCPTCGFCSQLDEKHLHPTALCCAMRFLATGSIAYPIFKGEILLQGEETSKPPAPPPCKYALQFRSNGRREVMEEVIEQVCKEGQSNRTMLPFCSELFGLNAYNDLVRLTSILIPIWAKETEAN